MDRREFSRMLALGGAGFAGTLNAARLAVPIAAPAGVAAAAQGPVQRADRMAWAREHFRGFENVLLPSFTPDLKDLDEAGIRLDVRQSIRHGFFSMLCAPPSLSMEEMKRFMQIAVDEAAGRISVAFALHAPTEKERFDLMEYAEGIGVQHMLLELPKEGSAEALIDYGLKYATNTNLGVYLWMAQVHNFKRFHPSAIPFQVFDRLADEPNVIALKVGALDPAVIFHLFERYNDRMLIGALWPNVMPMAIKTYGQQWSGAWTVEALQSPETPYATDFFNTMMAGNYEEGMQLFWGHVSPGFGMMMKMMGRYMASGAHPWELIKFYQFATGGNGGPMRVDPDFPDIPPVSAEDMQFVMQAYKRLGVKTPSAPPEAFRVGRVNYDDSAVA